MREPGSGTWLGLARKGYSDNVADLMVGKLKRLSGTAQTALQQLACLGNVVEICHPESGLWGIRRGDPHFAPGGRPHRADPPSGGLLRLPSRPYSGGGVRPYPRRASARGHTLRIGRALLAIMPAEQPRRASVRCGESAQSGRRTADRREREGGRSRRFTCAQDERPRHRRPMRSAREYFSAGMALLDETDWGSQLRVDVQPVARTRASASF